MGDQLNGITLVLQTRIRSSILLLSTNIAEQNSWQVRLAHNQKVTGSSPVSATNLPNNVKKLIVYIEEWTKGWSPALEAGYRVGSNPTPSSIKLFGNCNLMVKMLHCECRYVSSILISYPKCQHGQTGYGNSLETGSIPT